MFYIKLKYCITTITYFIIHRLQNVNIDYNIDFKMGFFESFYLRNSCLNSKNIPKVSCDNIH